MTDIDDARARSARLLSASPLAVPLAQALANIRARRQHLQASPAPTPDLAAPEPMPILDDPDAFAQGYFQRLMQRHAPPPRGWTPRLVTGNDYDPDPTDA